MNPVRRLTGATASIGALILVAGCSTFSEQTTTLDYAPSDGVQGEFGSVDVRNVLVVAEGEGAPGTLVGAIVNNGPEDVTVTVAGESLNANVEVPAGEAVTLGPDGDERVDTDEIEVVPGRQVRVLFSGDGGSVRAGGPRARRLAARVRRPGPRARQLTGPHGSNL